MIAALNVMLARGKHNMRMALAYDAVGSGNWAWNRSSDGINVNLIYDVANRALRLKWLKTSSFSSSQGIKPDSFYKVKVPELKEIIGGCIRMNNDERYERKQAAITSNSNLT